MNEPSDFHYQPLLLADLLEKLFQLAPQEVPTSPHDPTRYDRRSAYRVPGTAAFNLDPYAPTGVEPAPVPTQSLRPGPRSGYMFPTPPDTATQLLGPMRNLSVGDPDRTIRRGPYPDRRRD